MCSSTYYMNYEEVYIIGCDSNWVTLKETMKTKMVI